jgi:uncharacterized membrane protein
VKTNLIVATAVAWIFGTVALIIDLAYTFTTGTLGGLVLGYWLGSFLAYKWNGKTK